MSPGPDGVHVAVVPWGLTSYHPVGGITRELLYNQTGTS